MTRMRHTPEQVINKLREAEVAIAAGSTVAAASRSIGVTEQTLYRWRSEYGGLGDRALRFLPLQPAGQPGHDPGGHEVIRPVGFLLAKSSCLIDVMAAAGTNWPGRAWKPGWTSSPAGRTG